MATSGLSDVRISLASPLVFEPGLPENNRDSFRSPVMDAEWDRILDDLSRLRNLENDWDGQGALALDPINVGRAIAWVQEMRRWDRALPPKGVLPGTLGEVILEWRGDSFHLAAEISIPEQVEWLLNIPGHPIKQWQTDARCSWIVRSEK